MSFWKDNKSKTLHDMLYKEWKHDLRLPTFQGNLFALLAKAPYNQNTVKPPSIFAICIIFPQALFIFSDPYKQCTITCILDALFHNQIKYLLWLSPILPFFCKSALVKMTLSVKLNTSVTNGSLKIRNSTAKSHEKSLSYITNHWN